MKVEDFVDFQSSLDMIDGPLEIMTSDGQIIRMEDHLRYQINVCGRIIGELAGRGTNITFNDVEFYINSFTPEYIYEDQLLYMIEITSVEKYSFDRANEILQRFRPSPNAVKFPIPADKNSSYFELLHKKVIKNPILILEL